MEKKGGKGREGERKRMLMSVKCPNARQKIQSLKRKGKRERSNLELKGEQQESALTNKGER